MVMDLGFAPFIGFMVLVLWSLVNGVYFLATSRRRGPAPDASPVGA